MSTPAPTKISPPAEGAKITIHDGKLTVPDNPIIPFIEGDGTGPDIWRASVRVMDAAVKKAYSGKRKIHWMEVYAGEKAHKLLRFLAARRDRRGLPRISELHQGPSDDPGRRRHPLAERRAAPDARPVRLPAPGTLVQGCALSREAPGESGHGYLPREYGGHLHAGIEFEAGSEENKKFLDLSQAEPSPRRTRKSASPTPPVSASSRCRRKARSA